MCFPQFTLSQNSSLDFHSPACGWVVAPAISRHVVGLRPEYGWPDQSGLRIGASRNDKKRITAQRS
jgi:hypothetical protein